MMKCRARLLHVALACVLWLSSAPLATGATSPVVEPEPGVTVLPELEIEGVLPPIDSDAEYVPGEVIVKFRSGVSVTAARAAHARVGASRRQSFGIVAGLELATLAEGRDVPAAVAAYEALPEVEYAQPNYLKRVAALPSDPLFTEQWGLNNTAQSDGWVDDADIDAPEAWARATGSASVVVAIVDTGVDYQHPDLAPNMWRNPGEMPGNGLDDDGNGYVDDVFGWDAHNIDPDPMDDYGHGTHVAGVCGAAGDNELGVTGTAWHVSLMAVKMMGSDGVGTTAGILRALEYVKASDADIVNCSWGGAYPFDAAEYEAIQTTGKLFVAAAGNAGTDTDSTPFYPASYDLPNILAVGASTAADTPATFSNRGAVSVDVFAPGEAIVSTVSLPGLEVASDATIRPFFTEPFDALTNWGLWIYYGYPSIPRWGANTQAYTSAPQSVAVTGYVNRQRVQLRKMTPIDLSGADYPAMQFSYRCDLEPGHDYLLWGMYDASDNKSYVMDLATGDTGGQFRTVVVDLADFAGEPDVHPFFLFVADTEISSAEGYEGVWVDDVSVFDIDPGESGSALVSNNVHSYVSAHGTSMAAPYASGIAALLLSRNASLSTAELKAAIMGSVDVKDALAGTCQTGGRVNAYTAIVAANSAPTASPDAYTVGPGSPFSVVAGGVLANDADTEGDALESVLVSGPAHGDLAFASDGGFTYTPESGYHGADSFTYIASDGLANSDPATVCLDVLAPVSVYRFHNMQNGSHFYTASEEERDFVSSTLSHIYLCEGVAYTMNPLANSRPLYRFYNARSGTHFYTASDDERDAVAASMSHAYVYEGVVYDVSWLPADLAVFRFYNVRNASHFYTASAAERDTVIASWPEMYRYEGTAFYLGQ